LSEVYERADHLNARTHRDRASEYICQHNCPMFGENVGTVFDILPALQGRKLRP
jgi:hypothetical protein